MEIGKVLGREKTFLTFCLFFRFINDERSSALHIFTWKENGYAEKIAYSILLYWNDSFFSLVYIQTIIQMMKFKTQLEQKYLKAIH